MSSSEKDGLDTKLDASTKSLASVSYTDEEERKLIRKLDWRILPVVTILYVTNFIDRTNIGNAKIAGLEKDLKMVGNQYNIGLSVFYTFYALTEVPSNLVLKKIGAEKWIPTLILIFGIVTLSTSFIVNFKGYMVTRVFLGLAEGGMMPGVAYFLSTYYRRHELVIRICIFLNAAAISGAFGGLLASGLLKIKQLDCLPHGQWRNIFLIEGAITIFFAFCGYFLVPGHKESAKFLTAREREIAIARLARESIVEDPNAKQTGVWRAFKTVNTWVGAIGFFLANISVQGISLFMPSLLKGMGYSTIQSQLLTVPVYALAAIWWFGLSYISFRIRRRGPILMVSAPIAITGLAILLGTANKKANYAGIYLLACGALPQGPTFLTWTTNNSEPSTVRAVSSAIVVSLGSVGAIISAWIFLNSDAPRYHIANSVQISCQCIVVVLVAFLTWYNHNENRKRARGERDYRLEASPEVVGRLGNLHPDFRLML